MSEVGLSIALSEKGNRSLKTPRKIADTLELIFLNYSPLKIPQTL